MRNAGRMVTRTMVVEHVWNLGFEGLTNIVDVYINYLRAKIDQGAGNPLIQTIRGLGYSINSTEGAALLHAESGFRGVQQAKRSGEQSTP
jgi:DNA-binding response OmpR family regulator